MSWAKAASGISDEPCESNRTIMTGKSSSYPSPVWAATALVVWPGHRFTSRPSPRAWVQANCPRGPLGTRLNYRASPQKWAVRTTPWQAAGAVTLPSGVEGRVTGNQQVHHSGLRLAVGQAESVFAGGQGDLFRNAAPTPVGVETGVPELIVVVVDADKEGVATLVRGLYTSPDTIVAGFVDGERVLGEAFLWRPRQRRLARPWP